MRPRGRFHAGRVLRGLPLGPMPNPRAPDRPSEKLVLGFGDPVVFELTQAIQSGDLDTLRQMLIDRPALASAHTLGRKGIEGGWGTPLHAATDWPGYFPKAPTTVQLLIDAGADPNDDSGGDRPETPLHYAASSDDVDVAVVLIDLGARLETPGGSIGTPLDNAIGYGCWHVARLLIDRGANVNTLWHAAALGMLSRLEELLDEAPGPEQEDLDEAFWQACHGGQRRTAERLLDAGADMTALPGYANGQSVLEVLTAVDTRRDVMATWLRERGAGDTVQG